MSFCGCWTAFCRQKDKNEKLCDEFEDCDKIKGDNGAFGGSKDQSDLSFDILGKSEAEEILKGGVEPDAGSVDDNEDLNETGDFPFEICFGIIFTNLFYDVRKKIWKITFN